MFWYIDQRTFRVVETNETKGPCLNLRPTLFLCSYLKILANNFSIIQKLYFDYSLFSCEITIYFSAPFHWKKTLSLCSFNTPNPTSSCVTLSQLLLTCCLNFTITIYNSLRSIWIFQQTFKMFILHVYGLIPIFIILAFNYPPPPNSQHCCPFSLIFIKVIIFLDAYFLMLTLYFLCLLIP